MSLADEIKAGQGFLKQIQSQAKDKKAELEKAASQMESLAAAFKSLANGDPEKLQLTLTKWEGVNRLLAAQASAEAELTKGASPDWNKIGDGIATAVGISIKIALAVV